MLRVLLVLVALAVAAWALLAALARGLGAAVRGPRAPERTSGPPADRARRLVRDPVCKTHLPQDRALVVETDSGRHFFCSEACRDRFRAGPGAPAG